MNTPTDPPVNNKQILLVSRPQGEATTDNFRLVEAPLPAAADLTDGEVLVRHHYLSLDPYMRGRMNEGKSYAAPQPLDSVMIGGTVGAVVASRHAGFATGDSVVGIGGWQQYARVDARQPGALRRVDTTQIPLSAYLGPVGMPGVTGWYGLIKVCEPKAGETVVVSAASGAVGTVVGQLAKARGCRAVGIAGGAEKCAFVVDELGFDACIDYKAHADAKSLSAALKAAAPDGVDCYFENVGGAILDAVLPRMNAFGRVAFCGMISGYDGQPIPMTYPQLILQSRLKLQGFIVAEHLEFWAEALKELGGMVASGRLKYRETVAHGIESAPEAFLGLLKGRNFGKQLVKLVDVDRRAAPREALMERFAGGTAVITGAASGLGLAAARIAAARGMNVVMADVQADALQGAAAEVAALAAAAGAQVMPHLLDVAKAVEVEALGAATLQRFGVPNLVFNNAGVGAGGLLWEQSAKDWEWVIGVNLMGVAHGVRVFTPMMLAAARRDAGWQGHIVNTASMAGLLNAPNMGVYNVTKHAVVSLSETLYQDLRLVTEQIGASVLCPFFVPTGIAQSQRNRPDELRDAQAGPTPSQVLGQAMTDKAVSSGRVTASQVAELVFDAVGDRRFYIYSHPQALASVQTRLDDIMLARNPSDPFAHKPELVEHLRAALRGAG